MKKMFPVFACLFLISLNVAAQPDDVRDDAPEPVRLENKFFIGGFLSPDLSYSIIPRADNGYPVIKNYSNNYDVAKFSITVGFEAMYQISELFSVTAGLQYSGKGGKTNDIDYYPSTSTADFVKAHYEYDYRYIDIPVRVDFYLNRKKVAPFITAGVSTNVFVNQRTYVSGMDMADNGTVFSNSSSEGFSRVIAQLQVGAGVDIAIHNSRLRIFPIYRVSISDPRLGSAYNDFVPSGSPVKGKLYSIGLGINYLLRL